MALLLTGGAGFVASTLTEHLLSQGEKVIALDNLSRGSIGNVKSWIENPGFELRRVELANLTEYRVAINAITKAEPITEVWHLAANSDIPAGVRNPDIDLRDTFLTTFNTLKLMDEYGIKRIYFASSSAIYGDLQNTLLTESTGPLLPISNYGAMKLASEAAISAAAERFLEQAIIFRFPNVVGIPATHGVIFDFIGRLRERQEYLQVLGDGTQRKAYLHVTDLVDAMLLLHEKCNTKIGVYNIGPTDEGITVRRIAEQVVATVAPAAGLRFESGNRGWVGDVPTFRYSTAKLQELGWKPRLDSAGAIKRAIVEIANQLSG